MIFLFVELVSFGGYQQMDIRSRKGCKDKKKRKSYERQPCSEETKAKIKASAIATRDRQKEEKRRGALDIRERLAEDLFGIYGELI